jgi:hypothetical protein
VGFGIIVPLSVAEGGMDSVTFCAAAIAASNTKAIVLIAAMIERTLEN